MPNWLTHVTSTTTTPGFWTGSTTTTTADNCSATDKTNIQTAFNNLSANRGLNCFPALRDAMLPRFASITIDCCFDNTRPPRGGEVDALIFICQMTDPQIQIALCTGLATAASGGTSLDVKAMLMSCFGKPVGVPTTAEFNEMTGLPQMPNNTAEFVGQFCIWNRQTGEVFDKTTVTTGGFWTGSTNPAKGARCFIDAAWVF